MARYSASAFSTTRSDRNGFAVLPEDCAEDAAHLAQGCVGVGALDQRGHHVRLARSRTRRQVTQTRSELQTAQPYPSKNNKRDKLITNADGSVDLYFGPQAPAGKEANWTATVPGKGWFAYFRWYGPTQAFFDKTWALSDIELVR